MLLSRSPRAAPEKPPYSAAQSCIRASWPDLHWTFSNLDEWPQSTAYYFAAEWVVRTIFGWDLTCRMWPPGEALRFFQEVASEEASGHPRTQRAIMESAVRLGVLTYGEIGLPEGGAGAAPSPPRREAPMQAPPFRHPNRRARPSRALAIPANVLLA